MVVPENDQRADLVKEMRNATDSLARSAMAVRGRILRRFDLTIIQSLVLECIHRENEPPDMAHISDLTSLSRSTLTSVVDRLEEMGLAQRHPHPVDRRRIMVSITPRGSELMGELDEENARLMFELLTDIPAADVRTMIAVLHHMANALATADLDALIPIGDHGSSG